jgi:CRP-like cAMP-binding protein
MNTAPHSNHKFRNRILSALPQGEYERVQPNLLHVELPKGEVVYEPNSHIPFVYFPDSGSVSIVAEMEDGSQVEVGIAGREGMVGLPILLGADSSPFKAFVQIPGAGMRIKSEAFKDEVNRCGEMNRLLLCYAHAFFVNTAMAAVCNRLHRIDARLARWLLTAEDRAQTQSLELTHEFLSIMLGSRRAGVTEAVGRMQAEGLIESRRGLIRILDQDGLEAVSCECYRVVRSEFDRLLGDDTHFRGAQ